MKKSPRVATASMAAERRDERFDVERTIALWPQNFRSLRVINSASVAASSRRKHQKPY
jgi:hypothetical protein